MKKKLLHVIEAAGGGALQYVVDICNHLSSEDWDIEVVFSRRNVTPKDVRALFRLHVTLTEVIMTREISMKSDFQNFKYLHKKISGDEVGSYSSSLVKSRCVRQVGCQKGYELQLFIRHTGIPSINETLDT
ncbi:hypothetical protein [Cohnella rhizosphaerae]|uniref:Uncharacterized protein n=1 Tax=Cohnella rhizosphaerae TaxID=1457232 RepID=A0A9X4KV91_9BACL|nr:hypothetical protein [Cohnella rhizosphaerae]MDG0811806.1 hypothetical protein [Cohnella rhizosphaerae]